MSTPPETSSITLSNPNAVSVKLPATTSDAIATRASIAIHAIVSDSKRNAFWIKTVRSGTCGAH
jgi:hypothetical protein